jgi:protease I
MMSNDKRIAILVEDNFEQAEFTSPKRALTDAGFEVDVVSPNSEVHGLHHLDPGDTFQVDCALKDANAADYDAVVLPGGANNADKLRMNEKAREFVREMYDAGKIVAAVCHAPWLLVSNGLARGHRLTSYFTVQDDIRNAGGNWVDEEVVIDGNLITSRKPDDLPAFNKAIIERLGH